MLSTNAGTSCSVFCVRVARDASYVPSCAREFCLQCRVVFRIRVLLLQLLLLMFLLESRPPAGVPFIFLIFFIFVFLFVHFCIFLCFHFSLFQV